MCVCVMGSVTMGEAAFGKTLTLPLTTWTKINAIQQAKGLNGYAEAIAWCVGWAWDHTTPPKVERKHKHGKK